MYSQDWHPPAIQQVHTYIKMTIIKKRPLTLKNPHSGVMGWKCGNCCHSEVHHHVFPGGLSLGPGTTWSRVTQHACVWRGWVLLGTQHVSKGWCGECPECNEEWLPPRMRMKQAHGSDVQVTDKQLSGRKKLPSTFSVLLDDWIIEQTWDGLTRENKQI